MDPVSVLQTALIRGLLQIARNIVRIGLASFTDYAVDQLQDWIKGVYEKLREKGDDQNLDRAIITSLERCGVAVNDPDKLRLWMEQTGLDRLGKSNCNALSRQFMLGLLGYTDPEQNPPENILIALKWPRSRQAELGQFLTSLRASLADLDGWKEFLALSDSISEQQDWSEFLRQLSLFENYLVKTRAGQPMRVAVVERGLTLNEIIDIEQTYRDGLINEYQNHMVSGLAQIRRIIRLPLIDIYLELGLVPFKRIGESHPENGRATKDSTELEPLGTALQQTFSGVSDLLGETPRLVIVGKPGSGKTTTLKYIALMLAMGGSGANRLGLDVPFIPLLVRLADYARACKDTPSMALETFLINYIEEYYPGKPHQGEFLQLALEKGGCLILLDGLDEVGDIGDNLLEVNNLRIQVQKEVQRFADRRCSGSAANRIVVTSRLEGYRSGTLPDFVEMELTDLRDRAEVESFLMHWFAAYERERNSNLTFEVASRLARQNYVDRLMPAIMNWESMRRLAMNPLLLTILAVIHITGRRLPNRRVELYETVTRTLIENWRPAQTDHVSSMHDSLNANDIYYLMASLAYWLHENQAGGTMPETEWQRKIEELLNREGYLVESTELVSRFLRYGREETGLLTEKSIGQIGFFHITVEEYLAAVEIARQGASERASILESRWHNPRWNEVILLAAGVLDMQGNNSAVKNYIADLLWMDDSADSSLMGRPIILAGRTLVDLHNRRRNTATYRSVIRALKLTMQDLDPDTEGPAISPNVPLLTRVEAGDLLDELGWSTPDLYEFVHIIDRRESKEEEEMRPFGSTSESFWIGKYPVTNMQYKRFLDSGEFTNPEFWKNFPKFDELCQPMKSQWKDVGWRWLVIRLENNRRSGLADRVLPTYWNDPRFGIARPYAPVVGISWFEANAYCRWLAHNWDDLEEKALNPKIRPGRIRLPTEHEWITAAGGDRMPDRFPWDQAGKVTRSAEEIVRCANVREAEIGRTSNVVTYPLGVSQWGTWDMAGNCWEWLANYFSSAHMYLTLRGGSWVSSREFARLNGRIYDIGPNHEANDRGFRVSISAD